MLESLKITVLLRAVKAQARERIAQHIHHSPELHTILDGTASRIHTDSRPHFVDTSQIFGEVLDKCCIDFTWTLADHIKERESMVEEIDGVHMSCDILVLNFVVIVVHPLETAALLINHTMEECCRTC